MMKKLLAFLMFMLVFPVSCFAAYPDLCQSFGCYDESSITKDVAGRYGNWKSREAIFMSACQDKPSLLEIIRISHPNNGVVTKKVEIGMVYERNPKNPYWMDLNIVYTKLYHLDTNGNVIDAKLVEAKTTYDMRVENVNEFRLELWRGPVGNASPRVIDEINFVKRNSAPPEEMDADLQKFWNVYRS